VELEVPVGVGGEPVVVAAVEHDGVVVADAAGGQERLELLLVDEVPANRVLQVLLPVQLHGAGKVAAVVGGGVLVDLDEDHAGPVEVLFGPVGRHEYRVATHGLPLDETVGPRAVAGRSPVDDQWVASGGTCPATRGDTGRSRPGRNRSAGA